MFSEKEINNARCRIRHALTILKSIKSTAHAQKSANLSCASVDHRRIVRGGGESFVNFFFEYGPLASQKPRPTIISSVANPIVEPILVTFDSAVTTF